MRFGIGEESELTRGEWKGVLQETLAQVKGRRAVAAHGGYWRKARVSRV